MGGGGDPNFGSERTVELFCGKLLLPHTPHTLSHLSRLHVIIPWPLAVYCFASRGEQIIGGYPKTIKFFNTREFSVVAKCNARFIKKFCQLKSVI